MNLPWDTIKSSLAPLTAGKPNLTEAEPSVGIEPVIVLGAGLAGCWLARLLAEQGIDVRLIESQSAVAMGASGNPAGIVKPYVTRLPCPAMDFHVAAHRYLLQQLETLPELRQGNNANTLFNSIGVLQLVHRAYPESSHYDCLDGTDVQTIAGISLNGKALHFHDSGWLDPSSLCCQLVKHPNIRLSTGCRVSGILRISHSSGQECWQLTATPGRLFLTSRLVLACGNALNSFTQTQSLPIMAARGQISRFGLTANAPGPRAVINGKHYVIPDNDSVLVGATFDRGIADDRVEHHDHARNLAGLHDMLPALQVHATALAGYAGVRATTPDRLPLVGPAPNMEDLASRYADLKHGRPMHQYPALPCHEGLFVLGGLGSRGIVTAPMAAMILTDLLTGTQTLAWDRWAPLLNPVRFRIRDLKRGKERPND